MHATRQPLAQGSQSATSGLARPVNATSAQVKSADLLKGHKTVDIEHNGLVYRLQTTKLGKLILTK
jgi:hemin uptake protein HemP